MKAKIFKVVSSFADTQDGMYIYRVGDLYPRMGHAPTEDRINMLLDKKLITEVSIKDEEDEQKPRKENKCSKNHLIFLLKTSRKYFINNGRE